MTLPYLIIGAGVIALIAGWIGYHIGSHLLHLNRYADAPRL
jgi:hypothetical protein